MSDFTLNQRWAAELVGALVACGVKDAVVAPGSRSTPLALAFADRASDARVWSVIDERSAAFFALGLAKVTRCPVAVVCTSGSAGAHFLPAAMEAAEGAAPLVLLTADRPWELHGFGAAQTADQASLFSTRFVRAVELLPTPDEHALSHVAPAVARAVASAVDPARPGPVHLNVPFREPLAPPDGRPGPVAGSSAPTLRRAAARFEPADLREVSAAIDRSARGLIVCGPREADDGFGAAVHALGARLGYPVWAEAASNARYGFGEQAFTWYDAVVRQPALAQSLKPDLVLRFGGGLTSKFPQQWLDASGAKTFTFCDDDRLFDPSHRAAALYLGSAVSACRALMPGPDAPARDLSFRNRYLELQHAIEARMNRLGAQLELTEPLVARALVAQLPARSSLVVSSSMPIRDVDAFASTSAKAPRVFSNRGLNGIDGVMSTALGVAAGSKTPTALLIGDVALLHDLSAWVVAKRHRLSLVVVVVNNDGGGIFQFLPVADKTAHFEGLFGTPHGIDLSHVAALAEATLHRPATHADFERAVQVATGGGLHLIEVRTDRRANVDHHRALFNALTEGLS